MKEILSMAALLISLSVSAQGNLQFNQVLSYVTSAGCNTAFCSNVSSSSYTVPAGKVWKLESSGFSSGTNNTGYWPRVFITVNGAWVYGNNVDGNTYQFPEYGGTLNDQPIWLKEGDVLGFALSSQSSLAVNMNATVHFSIIEFNVVP